MDMLVLNRDRAFQYELLRVLGTSHDRGADVGEVLRIAPKIIPGDFESWHEQFRFNVPTFEGPGQPAVHELYGHGLAGGHARGDASDPLQKATAQDLRGRSAALMK
jgi:hypothetical protein